MISWPADKNPGFAPPKPALRRSQSSHATFPGADQRASYTGSPGRSLAPQNVPYAPMTAE